MRLLFSLAVALLLAVFGCGRSTAPQPFFSPAPADYPSVSQLPIPPVDPGHAALPRTSSAAQIQFDSGNVFDYSNNGETGDRGAGTFAVLPGGEDDLNSAWAIFSMQLAVDDRPVSIELGSTFATLPGGEDDLVLSFWLAVYSFSQQRWDWVDPPPASADPMRSGAWSASGTVDVGLNSATLRERYCNLGGEVYFCVLVEPKVRAGAWCGVVIQPSTLHLLDKGDPAYFKTAPLSSGTGAATGDTQNAAITVQVGADPSGEANRIYVQRREAKGAASLRGVSSVDAWDELGFVDGAGGTYTDPDDNRNPLADDPKEGQAYEYRTVAAVVDGAKALRAAPSMPAIGTFGWSTSTVHDSGANNEVGTYTSLAIVQGRPAIAYVDVTGNRLLYVRSFDTEGTDWASPVTVTTTGGCGGVSLAVVGTTPPLLPAIAYYDLGSQTLKYVLASNQFGSSWGTPLEVDSTQDAGHDCDLKMIGAAPRVPCIAYPDGGNGVRDRALLFLRAQDPTGTVWGTPETVETIATPLKDFQDVSLAEVANQPAIAYYDAESDCLAYVRYDGSAWPGSLLLAGIGNQTCNPSLCVNNGAPPVPLICFSEVTAGLWCTAATDTLGGSWDIPFQIDNDAAAGDFASLALVNGKPAVAYGRQNSELVYLECLNNSGTQLADWNNTPKVLDGNDGELAAGYNSLLDLNGRPAISYYGGTTGVLRYARLH